MAVAGADGGSDDPGCIPGTFEPPYTTPQILIHPRKKKCTKCAVAGLHRLNSLMGVSIYDIADAVRQDNFGLFSDLVQRYRDGDGGDDINVNMVQGDYGHSALVHVIAQNGKADFFRELVRIYPRRVNVDLPHQTSSHRPLHLAAQGGHYAMIRYYCYIHSVC